MSEGALRILDTTAANRQTWISFWGSWPQKNVHAHPDYLALYADDKTQPYCAIYELGEGRVLYPFMLRNLSNEPYAEGMGSNQLYDTITPYGYGGAFYWGTDQPHLLADRFWPEFDSWGSTFNLVSEVIKFSVVPQSLLPYPGTKEEALKNVVVELGRTDAELWMGFEHKVRKNVNKAMRAHVKVEVDETGQRLDEFLSIYSHTMERRQAKPSYFFQRAFFESIHRQLQGQYAYFFALHAGRAVSTELVLISEDEIYSFLGGTNSDSFNVAPNDLLKYHIIQWGQQRGKKRFVLGGGNAPDDGIYKYKQAFSPKGSVPFMIGWRILNGEIYQRLIECKRSTAVANGQSWEPVAGFVPEYRT